MATFVDVAGAAYPPHVLPLEGKSLLPALRGGTLGPRTLFWEHEGHRAVREGKWKLVARHGESFELYDMDADRTELHDLAAAEPERVKAMTELYGAWARRCQVMAWQPW